MKLQHDQRDGIGCLYSAEVKLQQDHLRMDALNLGDVTEDAAYTQIAAKDAVITDYIGSGRV